MTNGGILSGLQIYDSIRSGDIRISPFEHGNINFEKRFNPTSYDLTLGRHVAVYHSLVQPDWDCGDMRHDGSFGIPGERLRLRPSSGNINHLDSAQENKVSRYEMDDRGLMLLPGIGYLMHTEERIYVDKFVPIIDGKSSIGRLFCFVHGLCRNDGGVELYVTCIHPIILFPGMSVCSISFSTVANDSL